MGLTQDTTGACLRSGLVLNSTLFIQTQDILTEKNFVSLKLHIPTNQSIIKELIGSQYNNEFHRFLKDCILDMI